MIRVLVVDDEALLRTAFSSLIGAEDDLEVVGTAGHGREAVSLAASLAPDVVVMDVRMPVMDGLQATRQILAAASTARPRVLMTDWSTPAPSSTCWWAEYRYAALVKKERTSGS